MPGVSEVCLGGIYSSVVSCYVSIIESYLVYGQAVSGECYRVGIGALRFAVVVYVFLLVSAQRERCVAFEVSRSQ